MKQTLITKIKNGKITLPKELRKEWSEGEVVFMRSPGGFLVKSITPPSLTVSAKRLTKAAKRGVITPCFVATTFREFERVLRYSKFVPVFASARISAEAILGDLQLKSLI